MKRHYSLSLAVMLAILASCTTSQFSTTQRTSRNGRTVYVNRHARELHSWKLASAAKPVKHSNNDAAVNTGAEPGRSEPAPQRILPIYSFGTGDNLIASAEKVIVVVPPKPFIDTNDQDSKPLKAAEHPPLIAKAVAPDTVKTPMAAKDQTLTNPGPQKKKIEGFGLAGFLISLAGLFVAGIPLGILAVIFGIVGIGKVERHPEKRKGKGFGIAAVIIGTLAIIGAIIVLVVR